MLACGSWSPTTNECEIYNIDEDKWEQIESYPYVLVSLVLHEFLKVQY